MFPKSNLDRWSSAETTLPQGVYKQQFDKKSVLERFEHQLKTSGLTTKNTMKPNFSWSCSEINEIKKKYDLNKYILLFPFCSPHLVNKKWPYYNELIDLIKKNIKMTLKF